MTHLQANTGNAALWSWMFVMGIGIGPSMAGFTVVIQNSAPINQLGVATSTLTFLRQIGGSVGLAIAGTLFSQSFTQKLPGQLLAQGVPGQVVHQFTSGRSTSGQGNLTGVGLAAKLHHVLPPQLQSLVPRIVSGVYNAFSLAIGQVFWLTFGASVLALLAVLVIPDLPLRDRTALSSQMADSIPGSEVSPGSGAGGQVVAQ
jgi:hypothetical protein